MKVIVNGFEKDYTKEEVDYLKDIYGYWETKDGVLVFKKTDFLNVKEIADLVGIQDISVYQRHKRDPKRYPLVKRGTTMGIDSDKFLRYWI